MDILDQYIRRAPDTASRVIEGEAVIIIPSKAEVKILNEAGARIWEMADGEKTLNSIIDELSLEFDAGKEQLKEDALSFLGELKQKGMVVLSDESNAG